MPRDDTVIINNAQSEIGGPTLHQIVSMAKKIKGPDAKAIIVSTRPTRFPI